VDDQASKEPASGTTDDGRDGTATAPISTSDDAASSLQAQPPTQVIRPFDVGGWFPIHNAVFDVIMPSLSPNAWKILCVAIRQTVGWVADPEGDPAQRKEWDRISYSQFQEKAGIGGKATTQRALEECLESGYLIRRQEGTYRGKPAFVYALNRDYEIELPTGTEIEPVATTPEMEPVTTPKMRAVTTPKMGVTKQIETKETKGDGGGSFNGKGFDLLVGFGISEPVARDLAAVCEIDQVEGWVTYARGAQGLRDPAALVVARLRAGEPAPVVESPEDPDSPEARRRRYTGGEFAEYIHS
jgi:hypothetical protein